MKAQYFAIVIALALTACAPSLPADVRTFVEGPQVEASGDSTTRVVMDFKQLEITQNSKDMGIEDAWCIDYTFKFSNPQGFELRSGAGSMVVYRNNGLNPFMVESCTEMKSF